MLQQVSFLSTYNKNQITKRFEVFKKKQFIFLFFINFTKFFWLINWFFSKMISIKQKQNYTIFFLDLINTYRSWRHTIGLPLRGQRTWSNANTTFNSNKTLRLLRTSFFLFKKPISKTATLINTQTSFSLVEQVNLLWKLNWTHEWLQAKKKQVLYITSSKKKVVKVDIPAMESLHVYGFFSLKNKDKKSKNFFKKNQFSLGFNLGFTKYLSTANELII